MIWKVGASLLRFCGQRKGGAKSVCAAIYCAPSSLQAKTDHPRHFQFIFVIVAVVTVSGNLIIIVVILVVTIVINIATIIIVLTIVITFVRA